MAVLHQTVFRALLWNLTFFLNYHEHSLPFPPEPFTSSLHIKNISWALVKESPIYITASQTMGLCTKSVFRAFKLSYIQTMVHTWLSFWSTLSLKHLASSAWRFCKYFSWSQVKTIQSYPPFRDLFLQWERSEGLHTDSVISLHSTVLLNTKGKDQLYAETCSTRKRPVSKRWQTVTQHFQAWWDTVQHFCCESSSSLKGHKLHQHAGSTLALSAPSQSPA